MKFKDFLNESKKEELWSIELNIGYDDLLDSIEDLSKAEAKKVIEKFAEKMGTFKSVKMTVLNGSSMGNPEVEFVGTKDQLTKLLKDHYDDEDLFDEYAKQVK